MVIKYNFQLSALVAWSVFVMGRHLRDTEAKQVAPRNLEVLTRAMDAMRTRREHQ